jgi:hypothetical protein
MQNLGQVPLVLGPGSWGFPGLLPPTAPMTQFYCPANTRMNPEGACLPTQTREGQEPVRLPPAPLLPARSLWAGF